MKNKCPVGIKKVNVRCFFAIASLENTSARKKNPIARLFNHIATLENRCARGRNPIAGEINPIARGGNYNARGKNPIAIEKKACASGSLRTVPWDWGDLLPQYLEQDQKYTLTLEERKPRRVSHRIGV